jgi:CRP-like cAMP-binding protein/anti-anti-sigma regulatory factor
VILVVATVAIAVDLVAAVGIGVAVTIVSFLAAMSRSAVRRVYTGEAVHSRKTRDPRLSAVLAEHGRRIVVFELEGPIFFGTAESLAERVDASVRGGATHIVLDLKRVSEVDSTGAKIIRQMALALAERRGTLLLSHVSGGGRLRDRLAHSGVLGAVADDHVFLDTDHALEWAEDRLIAAELAGATPREVPLERLDALAGLDAAEREILAGLLARRTYQAGEVVFREGDEGRELFLIVKGTASVRLRLPGHARDNRLATFSPGTVFGELALLDNQPRSAAIRADEDLVCYVLSQEAFETLKERHEPIAIKLLANLARELSARLRRANRTISQLEA